MVNPVDIRKHPRFNLDLEVFEPEGALLGVTKNISLGGCFLETSRPIKTNTILALNLPDNNEKIHALFQIVWKNNNGMGAKFSFNDENGKTLSDWFFTKVIGNGHVLKQDKGDKKLFND